MAGEDVLSRATAHAVASALKLAATSPTGAAATGLVVYLLLRARRPTGRPSVARTGD